MTQLSLRELVDRSQVVMAHAWMVRTFVKHSEEVEDFPELMSIVRSVFDTARALETRVDDPAAYFRMLTKKISKLRSATEQFAVDALQASTHTNFAQAVVSMRGCIHELEQLLETFQRLQQQDASTTK
ncbi:hypothetical protein Mal4_16700 [Maioricimonas rarisocia]|uniref:Uncharacterized protein n=1 Tax=Maioricimonas rarisocia TaxID=2528026 RepID=A0A517Z4G4_9PLAN|nr:amidohydrolase [Maioricimonas rarisocia]QDU37359.1 hypothetical protein Mal4_16700 [Maioricimonas rarisocia]